MKWQISLHVFGRHQSSAEFLAEDGRCNIQVFLIDAGTLEARASMAQIRLAAFAVLQQCAPASGGIAINIGLCLVAILLISQSMGLNDTLTVTD